MSDKNPKKIAVDIRGMSPLLAVFDMPTSIAFYCEVLGFEIISSSGRPPQFSWALLRLNEVGLMLNTAYEEDERPPAPDPFRVASHADTTIYFGCPEIDAVYTQLRAQGIDVKEPKIAYYGMKQLYVTDPDGYLLCFQWPASEATNDQWRNWFGFDPRDVKDIPPIG